MLKRLVAGEFKEMAERLSATHYDPGVLADGTNTASYVNTNPSAPAPAVARAKSVPAVARPAAKPAPVPAPAPAKQVERRQQPVWQPAPPAASPVAAPRAPGSPLPAVTRGPAQPTRPTVPPRLAPIAPPARPAAPAPLFSETPVEMPHEDLPTLFAEELISEKSLDEVILAFLSADLEPPK